MWAEAAFFSEWTVAHTKENLLSSISKVMNSLETTQKRTKNESLVHVGLLQFPSNGLGCFCTLEWSEARSA